MSRGRLRNVLIVLVSACATVGFGWWLAGPAGYHARQSPLAKAGEGSAFPTNRVADMRRMIQALEPLQTPLEKPGPNDWRARFREPGQTFGQWLQGQPNAVAGKRKVLYIQPLGEFGKSQDQIVSLTADYLGVFFGLGVGTRPPLSLARVPGSAWRTNDFTAERQYLTSYLLHDVLAPILPEDGALCIGFTAEDLWPGRGWNFVFGEASLTRGVAVWSLRRFGDPSAGDEAFRLCLLRTMKLASHETGHVFGMLHCTAWACNMCGSNHLEEADRHPLSLCPQCLAKLCMATGITPEAHLRGVADFCRRNRLDAEAAFLKKELAALAGPAR